MAENSSVYKFGELQLEPDEQLLLRNGIPIPLKPKVFETLVILVASGGRLVTKDELVERVWPDTSASDEALAQNISQLRKILGDGADGSSLIQTVPKRGYRFVGVVQVIDVKDQPTLPEPQLPQSPETAIQERVQSPQNKASVPSAWKRLLFVVAGVVLIAIASIPPPPPPPPHIMRITFSGKVDAAGGIRIDGSRLFFMERNGSHWPWMQTSLSGGTEVPFATPFPNTRILALSPDRTEWLMGSFTDLSGAMPLWIVPAQGGAPFRVGDVMVYSATWFPDGKRILAAKGHEVFTVDRDGRNQRRLFEVQGQAADFHWHPDGSRFRFTVVDATTLQPSLWEALSDGSTPHVANLGLPQGAHMCCGMWMPDGKNYVFTAANGLNGDIWMLPETRILQFGSNKPLRLTAGPNPFFGPPVSEGKHLFVFGGNFIASPFRYDQQTGEFKPYLTAESIIDLAFSPDGEWIAYIGEGGILWRSKVDGSARLQLTTSPMRALRPRWSRDGKQILFVAEIPNHVTYTAFLVSAEGGAPIQILKEDKKYRSFADWSPDGESVVMDVLAGSTPDEPVTTVRLKTGQASEFPGSRGMRNVRWSPDRRFLAASSDDAKTLYFFNPALQKWNRVAQARQIARIEWSRDGRFLYFQDILDPAEAVFRLDAETLATERALDFSKPLQAGAVRCGFEGVAPDGSFLASIRKSALDIYALDFESP